MRRFFDRWLSAQAARPSGICAPLVGRWLERENRLLNDAALRVLAARPDEHLLELGCGPGQTLDELAGRGVEQLTAVDVSPAMVRRARRRSRRLRALVRAGRVDIRRAAVEALPFAAGRFDAALAVNAVYFWRPPLAGLREIRRVLRPGARLVLAVETPETLAGVGATTATGFNVLSLPALTALCVEAGFDLISVQTMTAPASHCVLVGVPTR